MHEINDNQLEMVVGGYSWAQYVSDWKAGMYIIGKAVADAMNSPLMDGAAPGPGQGSGV
jgi:hypothetical protein